MRQTPIFRRAVLGAALALPALRPARPQAAARLRLIHLNDVHARHEPAAASGAACDPGRGPCFGGSARIAAAIRAARAEAEADGRAHLTLDAGDQFMGSLFHTRHRGAAEVAVQNAYGCEAMAPGNHEFNHGPETLGRFAEAARFPLLSANIDAAEEPALAGRLRGWAAFARGGARIVVIGLTTPDTPAVSSPGPRLRFTDPAEAAERAIFEARREGPATVVLLSHLGLAADLALARAVRGVDAVVGGHSHTLLGDLPGASGPAPILAEGPDRPVRIVQAGALGRYLGRLDLDLAADGRVVAHAASVREMTTDLPEDARVGAIVAEFAATLAEVRARVVGRLAAGLPLDCRARECALGNLVADAMLAAAPGAEVALQNAGGLRAPLGAGEVTYGDVLAVLPFGNALATLSLRGADLRAALENGLSQPMAGRFPQVGGIRFAWDAAAPPGQRLGPVEVRREGRWEALEPARVYRVVTNDFLRRGGDGYAVLRDAALEAYDNGPLLEEVVARFLAGGARAELEGRIRPR
ncbi:MAG: 5'-nucleotidase C-terminal domain-containing protein [Acetobacteraceae bacterium]|nr:5'-nucleotidase C-terminal domain-containing protein [Acetobacteraceae bacterium]MCX7685376.1 5'-nucleotidase C-terminal domain-containing protein [Acetobacteraceae bacterium]